jgi:hypothetical protein
MSFRAMFRISSILKERPLYVKQQLTNTKLFFTHTSYIGSRSQWPRSLRRRSLAARLLRLWVRIPPGAWIFVCCECCVLSGRGLCDGLITRPEESYRLWLVVVYDQETSKSRRLKPATGQWKIQPQWVVAPGKQTKNKLCTKVRRLCVLHKHEF